MVLAPINNLDSGFSVRTTLNQMMALQQETVSVNDCYPANIGSRHDGGSHPLSGYFATLAAAQAVYSFATALTQQVDYCACKLASNLAFGADASENGTSYNLNKAVHIPAGRYVFGADTWLIRNLASGKITGDGKLVTMLTGNGIVLGFDGLWYSELDGFSVMCQTTGAAAALDIDGNVPGHPYATRGVQGNTLRNVYIDGGNSSVAFFMCRQGGSGAQGSENVYINCHLANASFACYSQNGFNALANTFLGGNFQNYTQNGIYVTGGTVAVINSGFQSTSGYKQIENGGWDVYVGSAGAYEGCIVYGCRSESLRCLRNEGAVAVDMRGFAQNQATAGWFASTPYGPVAALYKAIVESGNLWVATTAGTTSGTKPTFNPASSPITDGSVVWTYTPFNAIVNLNGTVERNGLRITCGGVYCAFQSYAVTTAASLVLDWTSEVVFCDATSGAITVTMPPTSGSPGAGEPGVDRGRQITVKKTDTSANAVTISGPMEGGSSLVLPGGARSSVVLVWGDVTPGGSRAWIVVARDAVSGGGGGGMSIGGAVSGATSGSVMFVDGSANLAQDNTNFAFDDTNNDLKIGGTYYIGSTKALYTVPHVSGNNWFFGQSGRTATTGDSNVGIGLHAIQSVTSGRANVAFGEGALQQTTTGDNNLAIGSGALRLVTASSACVAIGATALSSLTSGDNNVGIGYGAFISMTSGCNSNVGIGTYAGVSMTSGNREVFIGENAGNSMTSGGDNTFVGCSAGRAITSGDNNTIIGSWRGPSAAVSGIIALGTAAYGAPGDLRADYGYSNAGWTFTGSPKAGAPAAGDLPSGSFSVIDDTSGGQTWLVFNNGGTIRKVQLT